MDFKTYENQLNEPYIYNPIDISVGFYGLFSYRNNAWDHVLERIRKYYPDAPIVLINDGTEQFDYSEMAKKYALGVTEENYSESNRKIIRRVVITETSASEYTKVMYSWGTYYFKNGDTPISESIWNKETK